MAEIEDIHGIIMGGVDQPVLNPHNLMINVDKSPTIDELERRVRQLEQRNTELSKWNEQLQEVVDEFERACSLFVKIHRPFPRTYVPCGYCRAEGDMDTNHSYEDCPLVVAHKALSLKEKLTTANKQLGGE